MDSLFPRNSLRQCVDGALHAMNRGRPSDLGWASPVHCSTGGRRGCWAGLVVFMFGGMGHVTSYVPAVLKTKAFDGMPALMGDPGPFCSAGPVSLAEQGRCLPS